jgi:NOL1/NOP2/fmu family ribosome biogenesis protein
MAQQPEKKRSRKMRVRTAAKPSTHLQPDARWEAETWRLIESQFGVKPLPGCRLLQSGQNRIRVISQEAYELVPQVPFIQVAGLYMGERRPNGIRLSLDGAQLIGPRAVRQILALTSEQAAAWLRGESIDVEDSRSGYLIVSHRSDILGCGSLSGGRLHNFLPKDRRPQKQ